MSRSAESLSLNGGVMSEMGGKRPVFSLAGALEADILHTCSFGGMWTFRYTPFFAAERAIVATKR
jgi:hypothetical protein